MGKILDGTIFCPYCGENGLPNNSNIEECEELEEIVIEGVCRKCGKEFAVKIESSIEDFDDSNDECTFTVGTSISVMELKE